MNESTQSFLEKFQEIVRNTPHQVAILCEGKNAITYQELDVWAQKIAFQLLSYGAKKESIVGICIEKSSDTVAAILGVWYAGAAFLPLDPALPKDRRDFIIQDSGLSLMICRSESEILSLPSSIKLVKSSLVSSGAKLPPSFNERILGQDWNPRDLAYVIYTSGSTGYPKGVMVEHRGIVSFLMAQIRAFEMDSSSRSLFYLSTSFDASVSDIGTALLSGATLCIEDPISLRPGPDFIELLKRREITHLDFPPSVMNLLDPQELPQTLRTVVIGGEACPPAIVREWSKKLRVVNVYGPTEATVCTSLNICDSEKWNKPLVGSPLPGVEYYILDENREYVADGTPGELYIGGPSLARGYLNRENLTQTKFIYWNGIRLYRTHDKVVRIEDGDIQFIGRIDRQFKLRGQLIEPDEIEARLAAHPAVLQSAVVKRKWKNSEKEGVVAFVIKRDSVSPSDATALRSYLLERLPVWMIPERFEFLSSFPKTPTGKTDLQKLVNIPIQETQTTPSSTQTQERSLDEETLLGIWKQVLKVDRIGIDDDFFDLGGDSLAILEVVARAEVRGILIPPLLMSAHPSISKLLSALKKMRDFDPFRTTPAESTVGALSSEEIIGRLKENPRWKDWDESDKPSKFVELPVSLSLENVFISGATGFLGSRLLHELLRRTEARFYCLVRQKDSFRATEAIRTALGNHGKTLNESDWERIIPVCGDISEERFGLDPRTWDGLTQKVDTVFHCAAHVHLLMDYDALEGSNVQGTWEIIRLLSEGRRKVLHYASTLSVFVSTDQNQGTLLETNNLKDTRTVYGGYAQTKWASEVLLRSVENQVGPIFYYRFGLITGDSETGLSASRDFLTLFAQGLRSLGCIPFSQKELAVDITPIDFAAQAFAAIALKVQPDEDCKTYHIANRKSLTLNQWVEAMRKYGIPLEWVSAEEFLKRSQTTLKTSQGAAEAATCLALGQCSDQEGYSRHSVMDLFQATDVRFDMRNTFSALRNTNITCPDPSYSLLEKYFSRFFMANISGRNSL